MFGSMESKRHVCVLWLADFDQFCQFFIFEVGWFIAVIMQIYSSKTRKLLFGVEVQSMLLKSAVILLF